MSDKITDKVQADIDPIKKILGKIPGFGGYIERTKRRDSDKILRDTIADRVDEQWHRISELQKELISAGKISWVDDLESAVIKLQTFSDRIRRAPRGYSGLFDAVMINEDELAKLYQYDADLLDNADNVSSAIDNVELSMGGDGLPASIRHLRTVSQECIDAYNRRSEVVFETE